MGGLDSMVALLWSPIYATVLLMVVGTAFVGLHSVARTSFERVGVWRALIGTVLVIGWVLLLCVVRGGVTVLAWQAFAVSAYFALVGAALICLPMAVMLARLGKYRLAWFVGLTMSGVLLLVLLAEMAIGPEVNYGVNRWVASVLPLCGYICPALVAFAIGIRMPLR